MRFELMTSSLPRKRSTPELHWLLRAEDEVRTRDPQLGRLMLYRLSYFRKKKCSLALTSRSTQSTRSEPEKSQRNFWWGEKDSNLRRRAPADLQSAPVGHFGISPKILKEL